MALSQFSENENVDSWATWVNSENEIDDSFQEKYNSIYQTQSFFNQESATVKKSFDSKPPLAEHVDLSTIHHEHYSVDELQDERVILDNRALAKKCLYYWYRVSLDSRSRKEFLIEKWLIATDIWKNQIQKRVFNQFKLAILLKNKRKELKLKKKVFDSFSLVKSQTAIKSLDLYQKSAFQKFLGKWRNLYGIFKSNNDFLVEKYKIHQFKRKKEQRSVIFKNWRHKRQSIHYFKVKLFFFERKADRIMMQKYYDLLISNHSINSKINLIRKNHSKILVEQAFFKWKKSVKHRKQVLLISKQLESAKLKNSCYSFFKRWRTQSFNRVGISKSNSLISNRLQSNALKLWKNRMKIEILKRNQSKHQSIEILSRFFGKWHMSRLDSEKSRLVFKSHVFKSWLVKAKANLNSRKKLSTLKNSKSLIKEAFFSWQKRFKLEKQCLKFKKQSRINRIWHFYSNFKLKFEFNRLVQLKQSQIVVKHWKRLLSRQTEYSKSLHLLSSLNLKFNKRILRKAFNRYKSKKTATDLLNEKSVKIIKRKRLKILVSNFRKWIKTTRVAVEESKNAHETKFLIRKRLLLKRWRLNAKTKILNRNATSKIQQVNQRIQKHQVLLNWKQLVIKEKTVVQLQENHFKNLTRNMFSDWYSCFKTTNLQAIYSKFKFSSNPVVFYFQNWNQKYKDSVADSFYLDSICRISIKIWIGKYRTNLNDWLSTCLYLKKLKIKTFQMWLERYCNHFMIPFNRNYSISLVKKEFSGTLDYLIQLDSASRSLKQLQVAIISHYQPIATSTRVSPVKNSILYNPISIVDTSQKERSKNLMSIKLARTRVMRNGILNWRKAFFHHFEMFNRSQWLNRIRLIRIVIQGFREKSNSQFYLACLSKEFNEFRLQRLVVDSLIEKLLFRRKMEKLAYFYYQFNSKKYIFYKWQHALENRELEFVMQQHMQVAIVFHSRQIMLKALQSFQIAKESTLEMLHEAALVLIQQKKKRILLKWTRLYSNHSLNQLKAQKTYYFSLQKRMLRDCRMTFKAALLRKANSFFPLKHCFIEWIAVFEKHFATNQTIKEWYDHKLQSKYFKKILGKLARNRVLTRLSEVSTKENHSLKIQSLNALKINAINSKKLLKWSDKIAKERSTRLLKSMLFTWQKLARKSVVSFKLNKFLLFSKTIKEWKRRKTVQALSRIAGKINHQKTFHSILLQWKSYSEARALQRRKRMLIQKNFNHWLMATRTKRLRKRNAFKMLVNQASQKSLSKLELAPDTRTTLKQALLKPASSTTQKKEIQTKITSRSSESHREQLDTSISRYLKSLNSPTEFNQEPTERVERDSLKATDATSTQPKANAASTKSVQASTDVVELEQGVLEKNPFVKWFNRYTAAQFQNERKLIFAITWHNRKLSRKAFNALLQKPDAGFSKTHPIGYSLAENSVSLSNQNLANNDLFRFVKSMQNKT